MATIHGWSMTTRWIARAGTRNSWLPFVPRCEGSTTNGEANRRGDTSGLLPVCPVLARGTASVRLELLGARSHGWRGQWRRNRDDVRGLGGDDRLVRVSRRRIELRG